MNKKQEPRLIDGSYYFVKLLSGSEWIFIKDDSREDKTYSRESFCLKANFYDNNKSLICENNEIDYIRNATYDEFCILNDRAGIDGEEYQVDEGYSIMEEITNNSVEFGYNNPKNKYSREIFPNVWVDVYDVLRAFKVEDGALAHLIKKALADGQRGHKDQMEDRVDILNSAKCAIRNLEIEMKIEENE